MAYRELEVVEKSPDELTALSDVGSVLLGKEKAKFSPYLSYTLVAKADYSDNLISFKKGEEKKVGGILAKRTVRVSKGKVVLKNEKKEKINSEIEKMVQEAVNRGVSKNALKSTQEFNDHDRDLDKVVKTDKSKKN